MDGVEDFLADGSAICGLEAHLDFHLVGGLEAWDFERDWTENRIPNIN